MPDDSFHVYDTTLRDELIGIQYGRCADPFGWVHKVC